MNTFVIPEEGLYHYGVLGMHWGVRRYQYKNGTLTPAGIARYRKTILKIDKKSKNSSDFGKRLLKDRFISSQAKKQKFERV